MAVKQKQSFNIIDYHLHTGVTIDCKMDELFTCERAAALGISEIAFTNHIMLNQPDYLMTLAALQRHWERIQDCSIRFPQIKIRLGIEMDYYPNREEDISSTIHTYEEFLGHRFDIILGSIHDIYGGFFSNKKYAPAVFSSGDLITIYEKYFDLATMAARSKLFDIIAHPDLIKKYTNDLTSPISYEMYRYPAERFIESLVYNGVGIEINTKGMKLPVNEPYPSIEFTRAYLSKIRSAGLQPIITLGSDAHNLDDVGYKLDEMAGALFRLGVEYITGFDKREQFQIKLC